MYGVGFRIRKRRIELGLTQTELAKKMGYTTKATISKVELKDDNITTERVKKFAEALECTPGYLMGWEESAKADTSLVDPIYSDVVEVYKGLTDEQKLKALLYMIRLKNGKE